MSEETGILLQPRTGKNESVRARPSPIIKLGIYQRVMNWCGKNQLATALFVILFVIILLQILLLFIVKAQFDREMRTMQRQIQMGDMMKHMMIREANRGK